VSHTAVPACPTCPTWDTYCEDSLAGQLRTVIHLDQPVDHPMDHPWTVDAAVELDNIVVKAAVSAHVVGQDRRDSAAGALTPGRRCRLVRGHQPGEA